MANSTETATKIVDILGITVSILLALGKLAQGVASIVGEFSDEDKVRISKAHQEAMEAWKKVYADIMAQP